MGTQKNKRKRKNTNRIDGLQEADLEEQREKNQIYKQQSRSRIKAAVQESQAAIAELDSTSVLQVTPSNNECVIEMLARDCALYIKSALSGCNVAKQTRVLEKKIFHSILKTALPDYLKNVLEVKQNQALLTNFKQGLATNVMVETKSKRAIAAKHMLCHLATTSSLRSQRGAAKALGIDRRNIMRLVLIRILDNSPKAFWNPPKWATRSNALTAEVRLLSWNGGPWRQQCHQIGSKSEGSTSVSNFTRSIQHIS